MIKKVDITPQGGYILGLKLPITGPVTGIEMSIGDIQICLHRRALVDEYLTNGNKIRLDLSNYDKDNNVIVKAPVVEEVVPTTTNVVNNQKSVVTNEKKADPIIPVVDVKEPPVVTTEEKIDSDQTEDVSTLTATTDVVDKSTPAVTDVESQEKKEEPAVKADAPVDPAYNQLSKTQKKKLNRNS